MKIEHKILITVGLILLLGTVGTVGLLYTTSEEADNIVLRYQRSTQSLKSTSVATVIETIEVAEEDPGTSTGGGGLNPQPATSTNPSNPTPPGVKPTQPAPNPNTKDGCFTNMQLKQTQCGVQYYGESQSGTWSTGTSGHSLKYGCMWFAMSAAASYISNQPVYVHELLHVAGCTTAYADSGNISVDIQPKMNCVGQSGETVFVGGSIVSNPKEILSAAGYTVSSDLGKSSGWYDENFINSGGVYLIHINNDNSSRLSKSGTHWFVVVGKGQYNGNEVYLIINGSGTQGGNGYAAPSTIDSLLNHCYKVSR